MQRMFIHFHFFSPVQCKVSYVLPHLCSSQLRLVWFLFLSLLSDNRRPRVTAKRLPSGSKAVSSSAVMITGSLTAVRSTEHQAMMSSLVLPTTTFLMAKAETTSSAGCKVRTVLKAALVMTAFLVTMVMTIWKATMIKILSVAATATTPLTVASATTRSAAMTVTINSKAALAMIN